MTPTITADFNWDRPLRELALELGCSHETARKLRSEAGYVYVPTSSEVREYLRQNPTRGIAECARLLNVSRQTVYNHLSGLSQRQMLPWSKMDWRLPSTILARIWEVGVEAVEDERTDRTHGKPVWDMTKKGPGYGCRGDINLKLACLNELQRRDMWVADPDSIDHPLGCIADSLLQYAKPIGLEHVQPQPEIMEDVTEEPQADPAPEAPLPHAPSPVVNELPPVAVEPKPVPVDCAVPEGGF